MPNICDEVIANILMFNVDRYLWDEEISKEEVINWEKNLIGKSPDIINGITGETIKNVSDIVIDWKCKFYIRASVSGVFLDAWRKVVIVPLYKGNGDNGN